MIRILLVDDHAVVRSGYRGLLECAAGHQIVAEAANGSQAYRRFLEHRPDVVITDLSLPGVGGIELLRRMHRRSPGVRALVFSVHDEPVFVERALSAGALGYVTKRSAPDTLVAAVAAVAQGRRFLSEDVQAAAPAAGALASGKGVIERLSQREFEIFRQLAEGAAVREIAAGLSISGKTVSNHCSQIRLKLGVQTMADMTRLAIAAGVVRV
jgi:DNA-binding NarL/FixJ family response regulator